MIDSLLLKKSMKYLGLSAAALANQFSEFRRTSKCTEVENIGRWLSGLDPVDSSLMDWVTKLVRNKMLSQKQRLVHMPSSKGLMIAVASPKSGVGKTTVAKNLAVIAKFSLNMKTTLVQATAPENKEIVSGELEEMQDLRINCARLAPDDVLACKPEAGEVVIIDVCADLAAESIGITPKHEAFLLLLQPDMYLVPADFDRPQESAASALLVQAGVMQGPIQLLHRPRYMRTDTAARVGYAGLDVSSEIFCPFFIPQTISGKNTRPRRPFERWQDEDQEGHFNNLFEHLVCRLGGAVKDPRSLKSDMQFMSLKELMDLR
ncbi:ParA family protein [Pseudomonas sp. N40(2020)]|uniref:ParA family protein n=1 Tax=Pseudomonas sp. N40(2020) TaxID=2767798 RepID=UPI001656F97C|nr:ParA family protein [Pseudomonas sp. N40(2020)]MBC8996335.1 ParA family protein [Pseudomonas sp. N40(2020)]